MWKNKIINFLLGALLGKDQPIPPMTKEQQLGLFAQLYENDTFRLYCDAREDYLIKQGMEIFLQGKLDNAKGLAGQLLEIRNLRIRAKASYLTMQKLREEKKIVDNKKV
mgnify:FL=1